MSSHAQLYSGALGWSTGRQRVHALAECGEPAQQVNHFEGSGRRLEKLQQFEWFRCSVATAHIGTKGASMVIYTKDEIKEQLRDMGLRSDDTILVHSSMKSIGEVHGRADAVLDAFTEHLSDGLLIFPTHTWREINDRKNVFDPATEPACVGILPNLFMRRPGIVRSWHPTHSVAALGRGAHEYAQGEERWDTPCSRSGCWGKLYDMSARILFVGCTLKANTIIHGVEEWNGIPNRLTDTHQRLKIRTPDGELIDRPMRRHHHPSGDVSHNYDKIEDALLHTGIARLGRIGDARTCVCDARRMVDLVSSFLKRDPDLFLDKTPIPEDWYSND